MAAFIISVILGREMGRDLAREPKRFYIWECLISGALACAVQAILVWALSPWSARPGQSVVGVVPAFYAYPLNVLVTFICAWFWRRRFAKKKPD